MSGYTYSVEWSEEDQEFVGRCTEFPSLSHLSPSVFGALEGIKMLVAEVHWEMRRELLRPPVPDMAGAKTVETAMTLRRRHLAEDTYFTWRCEHKHDKHDRASDRNDGPQQGDCEVELRDPPSYAHVRDVAGVEVTRLMQDFCDMSERVEEALHRVYGELRAARERLKVDE